MPQGLKAIAYSEKLEKITINKRGCNNTALKSINEHLNKKDRIEIRQIKYFNNIVEKDHRFINRISRPMLGFKAFYSVSATLIGIEFHHMLFKGQHVNSENMPVFEQFYALAA